MDTPELVRTATINDVEDDRYEVIRPISIDIVKIGGRFRAWTVSFNQEMDGYGFTEEEAVSDLKQVITAHLRIGSEVVREFIREKKQ